MAAANGVGPRLPASTGSSLASPASGLDNLPLRISMWYLGKQAYRQYQTGRDLKLLEFAIRSLRVAMDATKDDSPEKAEILATLVMTLRARYERVREPRDLEEAISLAQLADSLTPNESPDKPGRLGILANSRFSRFKLEGRTEDLEDAVKLQTRAVELVPDGHEDRPALLSTLGIILQTRFKWMGNLEDVERAIVLLTRAIDLTPDDHSSKLPMLQNAGISLRTRFEQLGNIGDLERAIELLARAVELLPDRHPNKPFMLQNTGNSLLIKFERLGNLGDLERAIALQCDAVELTPEDHPNKPLIRHNAGSSLLMQFKRLGNLEDLERAIALLTRAVELTPNGHPQKLLMLKNAGDSLQTRFEQLGDLQDLERAVSLLARAAELTPDHHPDKLSVLQSLGSSLQARFQRLGNLEDLERSIGLLTRGVELIPDGQQEKPLMLRNAGISLRARFKRLGNLEDLERAITLLARAVELTPDDHPDKSSMLQNAGNSLQARFERLGDMADLERAVALLARAADLTANNRPQKPALLQSAGNSLQIRFEQLGNLEDLERAIALKTRAVELTPDGHLDQPLTLQNAAIPLQARFERLGNLEDLNRAIGLQTRAVELTPDGHPDMPLIIQNAGISLRTRFERLGDVGDLERAIELQARAVDLTPDDHPQKPPMLQNTGNSLQTRFELLGNLEDLGRAITYKTNAEKLTPEGHPTKSTFLYSLSSSLWQQFDRVGDVTDLDEAIRCSARSVELLPENHSSRARKLRLLGTLFDARLRSQYAHADDALHAMEAFLEAMQHTTSHSLERLQASRRYGRLLSQSSHLFTTPPKFTLLECYKLALDLIPRCIWLGNDVRGRYTSEELQVVGETVGDAVVAAITAEEYGLAVEWLEAGRAVVWSQVLQLRTPLDDLQQHHPQLAHDLHRVSQALEHAASPASSSLSIPTDVPHTLDSQAQSSHGYALEYEKLIAQVRELKGFENFMQPKKMVELTDACASGPVVVINVHEARCDALILCRAGDVVHVPLPDFSLVDAMVTQRLLWDTLRAKRLLNRCRGDMRDGDDDRGGRVTAMDPPDLMRIILADLWTLVVKPIMDVVCTLVPPSTTLPHVTWCPTGPLTFLPLHAAGIYLGDKNSHALSQCVMDVAVSSYTPTLEALLKPRPRAVPTLQDPRVLIVSQPDTPGCSSIPGTTTEAAIVMSLVTQPKVLDDDDGTVQAVLEGMATHEWVHLACHGVQNTVDPTNSAFCLYDGQLTLGTLMSQHLPNADLAVLSACQTATGDEKLSEEAVHLAAGMLNIGYKSVIGTMWSISDSIAPEVMRVFYTVMAEQVKAGEELHPAYALHEATKALRKKKDGMDDFLRWVPFVHFGL
ncbi:CHAT domain-containing protein [Irpex rosettiformis]|uniref:CHAT domain-containing protein n=1 Tax=Irpex rosettiformis TaxID=378272 RepID=A0ACB8TUZ2_9APHY|nr:CHAT domain-containing protein [Irpex rosettiformis]